MAIDKNGGGQVTPPGPRTEAVLKLERTRYDAMAAGDLAQLERLLTSDYVYTHSSSIVHDKQGYLDGLRTGAFGYDAIQTEDEKVAGGDSFAVVTGLVTIFARFPGGPKVINSRYMSVWVCEAGDWHHAAWQSTPLPAK